MTKAPFFISLQLTSQMSSYRPVEQLTAALMSPPIAHTPDQSSSWCGRWSEATLVKSAFTVSLQSIL